MRRALRNGLAQGKSFARARGESLNTQAPGTQTLLNSPMQRWPLSTCIATGEGIQPYLLRARCLPCPGASWPPPVQCARRSCAAIGKVWRSVPDSSYDIIAQAGFPGHLHPHALDTLLLGCILLRPAPGCRYSRNVEVAPAHLRAARGAPAGNCEQCKTRRYPRTRINRGLTHWMLGTRASMLPERPSYAYLLAARERAKPMLTAISKHGFRLISRPAREKDPDVMADMHA